MPTVLLLAGDARERLRDLPDGCAMACVTSPPYFRLRNYEGGESEIGTEDTPKAYTESLVGVFREIKRVLRPDGSCWIVIGDCWASSGGKAQSDDRVKQKDLIGIPWMLAFALRDDGWYLREVLVWQKPNSLPESVRDRCTMQHEYILHLTVGPRYYHDNFAIAEPIGSGSVARISQPNFAAQTGGEKDYGNGTNKNRSARKSLENFAANGGGMRNARSVWTITTEPTGFKHFATFPTRLASRCIEASTPEAGCCAACGAPYRRLVELGDIDSEWQKACGADSTGGYAGTSTKDYASAKAQNASDTKARILAGMRRKETVGWEPTCACGSSNPPTPALVVDPFSGAGTTCLCAARLGRDSVGVDLNLEYIAIAEERISNTKTKCLSGDSTPLPAANIEVQIA